MAHTAPITILGSGLAGITVAREFRKLDKETPLCLISADHGGFYSKPMLSNALASGRSVESLITSNKEALASQLSMTIQAHCRVQSIDLSAHTLQHDGGLQSYQKLVMALGADPIRLPIAGNAAADILSVNDWDDYQQFRAHVQHATRILILGAGLIGCEFANDLLYADKAVTVLDLSDRPLSRLLPPMASAMLQSALAGAGVQWRLGQSLMSLDRHEQGLLASFSAGVPQSYDLVLSAVGLRPRTTLAQAAGLAVGRGIQVNRLLQSSHPDVFALGDCAEVAGWVLPYVMPIMQAARALAKTLSGTDTELHYPAMPVVVKTPALPTVVCPPPEAVVGHWQEQVETDGVLARFLDVDGHLRGFALTGSATAERAALAKEVPAWL